MQPLHLGLNSEDNLSVYIFKCLLLTEGIFVYEGLFYKDIHINYAILPIFNKLQSRTILSKVAYKEQQWQTF